MRLVIYSQEPSRESTINRNTKVIILYKYVIDSNVFLFEPTEPKIGHSPVIQAQVVSTYVQVVAH